MAPRKRSATPATASRITQRAVAKQINLGDITLTQTQHDKLVRHLVLRLDTAALMRDRYIDVFRYIDNEYHAWLRRDADDDKRQRDNVRGIGIKPVDEKLSLIFSQVDEAQTYLLSVLAPDEAMYTATAKKDEQAVAKGFATLMNQHAQTFKHYNNYAIFLLDALKYNFGAYGVHWCSRMGNAIVNNQSGAAKVTRTVVADGNEVCAFDPYNTLLDPTIDPVECAVKGEFFAEVQMHTPFRLRKMEAEGELFNLKSFVNAGQEIAFYKMRAQVRAEAGIDSGPQMTDWVSIFNGVDATDGQGSLPIGARETTVVHAWVVPRDLGLSKSRDYEIWRFVLGARSVILAAKRLDNAHGMLPINVAMPWQDHFGWQTKGATERLIPHQRFASFTMNVHQRATRKKLIGLTIYDANVIPLLNQDNVDMEGGKLPANTNGQNVDLRQKIIQFTDGPDTTNTLQNIEITSELMQGIMPTKMAQQVAQLDRATEYQAAATVQSASRRNLKVAKIINSQAMESGREMQLMNILQYQPAVDIIDDAGNTISINPKVLRQTQLRFTISDGLRGIDKLGLIMNIKEILNAVLQSQQASAQIDVVALINYWTSMLGDNTDFSQFRTQSPLDKLPADQRNLAFQLLQQFAAQQQEAKKGGGAANGSTPAAPAA